MKVCNALSLFGFVLLVGKVLSEEETSNGPGGEMCHKGQRCNEGMAICADMRCQCVEPYQRGDGRVNCYRNNTFETEVMNDPNMVTYNGNSIPLQLPCRYLWTHTINQLKDRQRNPVGTCEFKAYAFHQKYRGKFYVAGYDVAIRVIHDDGRMKNISIRFSGKAYGGIYGYIINATDNQFLPNGLWFDEHHYYFDPSTNLDIKHTTDHVNNIIILHAKKCGMEFRFRPYDCKLRVAQPLVPFASAAANCAFQPEFLNKNKVVGLPPAAQHDGITIDDILIDGLAPLPLARELTLLVRAFKSMAHQNSPEPNPQCAMTAGKLDNCDDTELVNALVGCRFILSLPRFINCYDDTLSGVNIMSLYNKCIDTYCDDLSCTAVADEIVNSGCYAMPRPYDEVTNYVHGCYGGPPA